jgi:hypothetical protein
MYVLTQFPFLHVPLSGAGDGTGVQAHIDVHHARPDHASRSRSRPASRSPDRPRSRSASRSAGRSRSRSASRSPDRSPSPALNFGAVPPNQPNRRDFVKMAREGAGLTVASTSIILYWRKFKLIDLIHPVFHFFERRKTRICCFPPWRSARFSLRSSTSLCQKGSGAGEEELEGSRRPQTVRDAGLICSGRCCC